MSQPLITLKNKIDRLGDKLEKLSNILLSNTTDEEMLSVSRLTNKLTAANEKFYEQQSKRFSKFTQKEYTDIEIQCSDGVTLYFVVYLLIKYEYFQKLFSFNKLSNQNCHKIESKFTAITMTYLLERAINQDVYDIYDPMDVFIAADYYQIFDLRAACLLNMDNNPQEEYLSTLKMYDEYNVYRNILYVLYSQNKIKRYNEDYINILYEYFLSDYKHRDDLYEIMRKSKIYGIKIRQDLLDKTIAGKHPIEMIYVKILSISGQWNNETSRDKELIQFLENTAKCIIDHNCTKATLLNAYHIINKPAD